MNTKTLTFRRAAASDLDAVTAIYDKIHAQEDAGSVTIGWVTGVYPTRLDAELAFGRNDLYVCETEGRVAASGILNQKQVDVYAEGCWAYLAEDSSVFVLHTLLSIPACPGGGLAARLCNSMRIRQENWAAPCCGWTPTKKMPPHVAYTRTSATGKRISCSARSTASRTFGSYCWKSNCKFT